MSTSFRLSHQNPEILSPLVKYPLSIFRTTVKTQIYRISKTHKFVMLLWMTYILNSVLYRVKRKNKRILEGIKAKLNDSK